MERIKLIADTASDIPDEFLAEYNIDMPSVPITVDGESYFERKSFSLKEFYAVINSAKEIPTTSRVPIEDYLNCYKKAYEEGYTQIISVTINAAGSSTNASAQIARDLLFEKNPEAKSRIQIHVVDSRTYAMAYGYPVVEAAKMARSGSTVDEILTYLDDYFARVEIYLGCYTLEYAKRSGRISAASAFVGDVLGVRPVISMIDGQTKTIDKVRGDKNLAPRLFDAWSQNCLNKSDPVLVVRGEDDQPAKELTALLEKATGKTVPNFYAGGSIIINAGPKMLAVVCLGKKREKQSKTTI